jgi:hypothetical protein
MDRIVTDEQQEILDKVAKEKRQEDRLYREQEYMYTMLVRMYGHQIETKSGIWELDSDGMSGGVYWTYDEGQMTLWCTPFWEATDGIGLALDIDSIPFDTEHWYRVLEFKTVSPLVDVQNFLDIMTPVLFEAEDLYRVLQKQSKMQAEDTDRTQKRMGKIVDDVMDELREVRDWLDREDGIVE